MRRPTNLEQAAGDVRRRRIAARGGIAAALVGTVVAGLLAGAGTASAQTPAQRTFVSDEQIQPSCATTPSPTGFCRQQVGRGTATVATTPGVAAPDGSAGPGYLQLRTPGSNDKATVLMEEFGGRKLSEITELSYMTLVEARESSVQAPSLQIEVVPNKSGRTGDNYARLAWEPHYQNRTVLQGEWQRWTPSAGQGGWWSTAKQLGFTNEQASFADVKTALPDAVILRIIVNQGSGNGGLVGDVDLVRVNDRTWDFENPVPPPGPRRSDVSVSLTAPDAVPTGLPPTAVPPRIDPQRAFRTMLTVSNAGALPAERVIATLTVPRGLRIRAADGGLIAPNGRSVVFRDGRMGGNESRLHQVVLEVEPRVTGPLTMTAVVASSGRDADRGNNFARETTTAVPSTS